jgi:hypothetical protein
MDKKNWLKAITKILELRQIITEEESKRINKEIDKIK